MTHSITLADPSQELFELRVVQLCLRLCLHAMARKPYEMLIDYLILSHSDLV